MAEVNTGDSGGGHGKHQKKRAKKLSTRIDMTPMVDLAFLLLTFFVLTSTFNKSKTLEVLYPVDPTDTINKPPPIKEGITFLLTEDDKVFYYKGEFNLKGNAEGKPETVLTQTDYSKDGVRKILMDRNKDLRDAIAKLQEQLNKKEINDSIYKLKANEERALPKYVTVLIKTDDKASYKNVVDVIDDLRIAEIAKMAVVDITGPELALMKQSAANSKP